MPNALFLAAVGVLLLALGGTELVAAWRALSGRRLWDGGLSALFGVALVALGALACTVTVATRGYHALTNEELAATVRTEPLARQRFRATVIMPGGRLAMYDLAGDAFYMDAHIVKWHPIANMLGLHTAYELDRVAGRYDDLKDEQTKPHTAFTLARPKLFDMFAVVRWLPFVTPIVDAEYGSATFAAARESTAYIVLVSTTGLLTRPIPR
jgi:hypothetical protein